MSSFVATSNAGSGVERRPLPSWYEETRVCAHTRLTARLRDQSVFLDAAARLRDVGFTAMVRAIKASDEGAWWTSSVGAVEPWVGDDNPARDIIRATHDAGLRLIVYYRHFEDAAMARAHPDWICRDHRGQSVRSPRGIQLCLNSPYADFAQTRLAELAEMGADAFYFDHIHMPKSCCWCGYCIRRFQEETGLQPPAAPRPSDPMYRRYEDFRNVTIERTFRRWQAALHPAHPKLVFIVSSNTYPAMFERHTNHQLYQVVDAMKTEFTIPIRGGADRPFKRKTNMVRPDDDARLALGWTLARDSTGGRPPHIWTPGLPDALQARFAVAGIVAHGGVANLHVIQELIPEKAKFAEAVHMGNAVARVLAHTRPLHWAAVHFSEAARDRLLPDQDAAWQKILYPVYGAYAALLRERLPVGIVTDSQLTSDALAGYRVLVLSSRAGLDPIAASAVEKFARDGGLVIEQPSEWTWHTVTGAAQARNALLRALEPALESAPVQVAGGPTRMHAVAFRAQDRRRIVVNLVNDFSWVRVGQWLDSRGKLVDLASEARNPPPPPIKGVEIMLLDARQPSRVYNAVTGAELTFARKGDRLQIAVPQFECLAAVTLEFDDAP